MCLCVWHCDHEYCNVFSLMADDALFVCVQYLSTCLTVCLSVCMFVSLYITLESLIFEIM